jgi:hypothetical protein
MADSRRYWFIGAGSSFTFSGALISADAIRSAGDLYYSFGGSPLGVSAYATAGFGLICLVCGLLVLPFPEPRRRRWERKTMIPPRTRGPNGERHILNHDDLREIQKVSASRGYTRAQAKRLLEPYYGRWMQLSAEVVDVGPWTGSCSQVTVKPPIRRLTAVMNFIEKDIFDDCLSILTQGTRVTAIGQIEQIEPNTISFSSCKIV